MVKGSLHSMVLIGAYHDSEYDRFWFVLQNSHIDGYFKLVDGEQFGLRLRHSRFSLEHCRHVVEGQP